MRKILSVLLAVTAFQISAQASAVFGHKEILPFGQVGEVRFKLLSIQVEAETGALFETPTKAALFCSISAVQYQPTLINNYQPFQSFEGVLQQARVCEKSDFNYIAVQSLNDSGRIALWLHKAENLKLKNNALDVKKKENVPVPENADGKNTTARRLQCEYYQKSMIHVRGYRFITGRYIECAAEGAKVIFKAE